MKRDPEPQNMNADNRKQWTFNDLERWLNERRITEIECLVPDLTGVARGKILPRSKFTEDRGMRLPESIIGLTVTGNWPEDERIDTLISDTDRDMNLVPDPSTVRLVPWAVDPTAQVIHDCYFKDGMPVDYAPRSVLKNVIKLYADKGWAPVVAPELEFYIVDKNTDPDQPLRPPVGRSGRAETSRQHYSIDAVNEFDPLFEDIYDYCDAMDLDVDTLIHEVGAGQMEINFLHGDPLDLADKVFFFKRTLREAALRHNMFATFMAKPMAGEPGSAMHVHQSIVDRKTGQNIFSNPDGTASAAFGHYIGGLQKYIPHVMALFAPYVNSYRRLVANTAAPTNVEWGHDNRTVGIRVPHSAPENRRMENRVIGADANPYVALAASLACGYLGMVNKIEPLPEMKTNAYNTRNAILLPQSLSESVRLLDEVPEIEQVLGKRFCGIYKAVKMSEYAEFMKVISPWEREHLLLHV
ncbi:putative glutamine synthetase (GS) [Thiomonas delicata]|jgi:glutamine synthetase|uniref:Putative glutamine synthetase (GS) n=2 Tax=Burkholderiales genera incertae sedis TaxID=224471 RepID=A0A238D0Q2_THIDL|nr:putative glutamine synthetase (GS) [Thiomonas delicata]